MWHIADFSDMIKEQSKSGKSSRSSEPFFIQPNSSTARVVYCIRLTASLTEEETWLGWSEVHFNLFMVICGSAKDDESKWPLSDPFCLTLHHPTRPNWDQYVKRIPSDYNKEVREGTWGKPPAHSCNGYIAGGYVYTLDKMQKWHYIHSAGVTVSFAFYSPGWLESLFG